jgi:dihydroneopterin aldolase
MPDQITIEDLEVLFHVGVPDEERAEPQRLLITIGMTHDPAKLESQAHPHRWCANLQYAWPSADDSH